MGELSFVQMFFCQRAQDQVLEEQSAMSNVCQLAKGKMPIGQLSVNQTSFDKMFFLPNGAKPSFTRAVCKFKCLSVGYGQNAYRPTVCQLNIFRQNVFIPNGAKPSFTRAVCKLKCL